MTEQAEQIGRRERKKRETHAAIHAAALQLFQQRGFRDTRISDIAEEADVSEATFFRYFSSKEEVALVRLMSQIDAAIDALTARPVEEKPIEACLAVMSTPSGLELVPEAAEMFTVRLIVENASVSGYFFWHINQVTGRLAEDFGRRLGVEPHTLHPQLQASAVIGALHSVLRVWLADPKTSPWEMAAAAFRALGEGFE